MSEIKKIVILGLSQVGKTIFYRKLVKKHALNQDPVLKIVSVVNYTECLIEFKNNYYFLIDAPAFTSRSQNEVEKARQNQTEELIKKSALIF